jgi:hypothetical protein
MPQQDQDLRAPSVSATDASVDALCRNLVYRFYELYDQAGYAELVEMFTPEGSWYRANRLLRGREQMLAALAERPAQRRSLHAVCNLQVLPSSPTRIDLRYWLTVLRSDEAVPREQAATIASPSMVLSARAEVVLHNGQPRFTHKALQREFLFEPA